MKVIPHLFKRLFYKNDTINELNNIFRIKFFSCIHHNLHNDGSNLAVIERFMRLIYDVRSLQAADLG